MIWLVAQTTQFQVHLGPIMIYLCKNKYSLFYKTSAANVHHCSPYLLL